ncbi:MAG: hypothetical protein LBD01_03305, partial [Puniceicoccales bacterium]|nr:hypothetical protein [Puniceicoccales bacterium]
IENEFFDLENFSGRAHFIAATGTYQHFYNFARKNRSRANKTPVELLREKTPNLHPRILLLHPCLLTHKWVNFYLDLPVLGASFHFPNAARFVSLAACLVTVNGQQPSGIRPLLTPNAEKFSASSRRS